jgi:hypothetical protein
LVLSAASLSISNTVVRGSMTLFFVLVLALVIPGVGNAPYRSPFDETMMAGRRFPTVCHESDGAATVIERAFPTSISMHSPSNLYPIGPKYPSGQYAISACSWGNRRLDMVRPLRDSTRFHVNF